MTDDLLDLAREVVVLPGWRWMLGMRAGAGGTTMRVVAGPVARRSDHPLWAYEHDHGDEGDATFRSAGGDWLPDLADPATLGCLLALVREAWGDPLLHVSPSSQWESLGHGVWLVWSYKPSRRVPASWFVEVARAATEAHALVAALRAAGGGGR